MNLVRQWRHRQKVTCANLAAKIGITEGMLRHIENGTRKCAPHMANLIAGATGIPREKLRPDIFK